MSWLEITITLCCFRTGIIMLPEDYRMINVNWKEWYIVQHTIVNTIINKYK